MQIALSLSANMLYLSIDHFHIRFETEALNLIERLAMMLHFFRKQTLHNFSTVTKITVVFRIER